MREKPARLDPNLKEHLCHWVPKVFASIHQRAETAGKKPPGKGEKAESSKEPAVVDVSIYEHRTISDTPLNPESTAIFFSHYAHLFIDIIALNKLAKQAPSRADHLLPSVAQLVPQPSLSDFENPLSPGVAELAPAEHDVLERLYWPKDQQFVEHEKEFWTHEQTEHREDSQSRKDGFRKAQEKWRGWAEEYFLTRWWALISNYHASFVEAVALGVAAGQKAHGARSQTAPPAGVAPAREKASGGEDPIGEGARK